MVGRIEIQPPDIPQSLDQEGIAGQLPCFRQVQLDPEQRCTVLLEMPSASAIRRTLQVPERAGLADRARLVTVARHPVIVGVRPPRPGVVVQDLYASARKRLRHLPTVGRRDPELGDRSVGPPCGAGQGDAGSPDQE